MLRAGIYNRCSTEEEAQINALDIQAQESREIVEEKGWVMTAQYIESQSGTTVRGRSEYQRLLEDMETELFDIVVIKSIDRLTRSAKDWYLFLDKLTSCKKRLYIYIDRRFYTPEDNLLTGIKAILAEDFSRELSKKIKNAHKRRQEKKSGYNITVPIFGWDKVGKEQYVINREEAEAYRLGFELAKEGKGFYTIANLMYERGVRSKRGTRISEVQWRKLLYSPRAHGTVVLHTREYDFETKKTRAVPEEEWIYIDNALPAIVKKEYQEEILSLLQSRNGQNASADAGKRRFPAGRYPLSGKLRCARCGRPYYRVKRTFGGKEVIFWKCAAQLEQGRNSSAGCSNISIRQECLFRGVKEACEGYYVPLFGEKGRLLEGMLTILEAGLYGAGREEKKKKQEELEKLERKRKLLLKKLLDELISDEDFALLYGELEGKKKELTRETGNIKQTDKEYTDHQKRMEKIRQALSEELLEQAQAMVLADAMDEIRVYPDKRLCLVFNKPRLRRLFLVSGSSLEEEKEAGESGEELKLWIQYEKG